MRPESLLPPGWLQPDWRAPAGVHAACSTRVGGRSCGAWAGLNLGDHVGDEPAAVAANRAEAGRVLGVRPAYLKQVHGIEVARADAATPHGLQADACITEAYGVACTIMVADCLPVLFSRVDGSAVGAAHAGWRGLAAGVLEATADALSREADAARRNDLIAWLGPCIGPHAFEVGGEVKAAFEARDAAAAEAFAPRPGGKWLADLPRLARQRLARAGITRVWGNDGGDMWCTVRNPSRFFSHRRDGTSGRFAAFVWRG